MYINTNFIHIERLLHVSALRGLRQGVLIHFVSRVSRVRDTYFVDPAREMYQHFLRMAS
jgi:hypothetical protein